VDTVPTVELPPAIPFTFQVTPLFVVFCTVAVNCTVRRIRTVAEVGEIEIETCCGGTIVTEADPFIVGVILLVAIT
jgi:hypothetical protein